MIDNKNGLCATSRMGGAGSGCPVVIDTYQVFDSCRDRDCFEDVRVYLDDIGQSIIEHTSKVRTKSARICSSQISVEPVQLSRGFFRITVRFFVKLELEACLCAGNPQSFCGIAAAEKSVVLYGGEGAVHVFRSNTADDSFCAVPSCGEMSDNLPVAVVETVDPVVLGTKVIEPMSGCGCHCCCSCCDIPASVKNSVGDLVDDGSRYLAVSLGFFSVIRIERPGQYLVNAVEFSIPDKECCVTDTGSPCDAFRKMAFPVDEFAPGRCATVSRGIAGSGSGDCGCKNS